MMNRTRTTPTTQARSPRSPRQYGATLETLFRSRFSEAGDDECWQWNGCINQTGCGKLTFKGRTYRANRLAWQFCNKEDIPKGMTICHACDNPSCVNPRHLWLGTQADNMADKVAKGRQHRGESHPATTLTEDGVRSIRSLRADGLKQTEIARRLGITRSNVDHVLRGNSWRHVT